MRVTTAIAACAALGALALTGCSAQGTFQGTVTPNTSGTSTPAAGSGSTDTGSGNGAGGNITANGGGRNASDGSNAGAPKTPDSCHSSELKLAMGAADHATSQTHTSIQFTNTGSRTCTLQGFPGVSFVAGDNGTQIGAAAQRTGSVGASVSLTPGATASAPLTIVSTGPFDPGKCNSISVRGLRVYPPNETAAVFLPYTDSTCSGNVGQPLLSVGTVTKG